MSSFANLKKSSGSSLEKLAKAVESMNSSGSYNDGEDKYWKCEVDKTGNGYAIIRFLPTPPQDDGDGIPWVKYYDHGFQGVGGWYIEKSLTTIGHPDPLSDYNSSLWNSGIEANKDLARKQKRRLHYVSNVYIVKDPKHPENEGKVFYFRYGKKIFEKITQAMNPNFEDDIAIDPFDLWTGANFKLKIRKVDGYQNYDLSEFDSPSKLSDDDAELEAIWKKEDITTRDVVLAQRKLHEKCVDLRLKLVDRAWVDLRLLLFLLELGTLKIVAELIETQALVVVQVDCVEDSAQVLSRHGGKHDAARDALDEFLLVDNAVAVCIQLLVKLVESDRVFLHVVRDLLDLRTHNWGHLAVLLLSIFGVFEVSRQEGPELLLQQAY